MTINKIKQFFSNRYTSTTCELKLTILKTNEIYRKPNMAKGNRNTFLDYAA